MKKNLFFFFFIYFVCISFFIYKNQQKQNLLKTIIVELHTKGSSCELNATHPIELQIINNSQEIITSAHIKYSVFEDIGKMYGDYNTNFVQIETRMNPNDSFTRCVISPVEKSYVSLTKEDLEKDGLEIKKSYPNAKVGFNIYNSAYKIKVNSQDFTFE